MNEILSLKDEIKNALLSGKPVVALESTIISHGLPRPRNLETAREIEYEVRQAGAIPATIAVMAGRLKVGLSDAELEYLAMNQEVIKLSTRDLALACLQKKPGATTVAATMHIAHMAGIRLFATGGIGGVHRGVDQTLDISTDLTELSRTPVAVVCSGAKSILDLPNTLEYLETMAVPVVGYQTREFPAFYAADSGLPLDMAVQSPEEAAEFLHVQNRVCPIAGALICNPAPLGLRMPYNVMEDHVKKALSLTEKQGLKGKAVTPFLLKTLTELTVGQSLETNVALVKSNARLAAKIAVAYSTS